MAYRRTRERSCLGDVAVVSLASRFVWLSGGSILGFASPPPLKSPSSNEIWIASESRRG